MGGRRVAIISPSELAWEARLEEDPVFPDQVPPVTQTMVFHGHSRAGNVTGPLIYANYGSRADFQKLEQQGVDVKGSIVLVRYYGSEGDRALKVKAAEMAGAVGCLIYSDPNEDGFKKGDIWPKGRWRPSDGVQRGAVSLMSWVVGDVLTPGYASTAEAERVSKDNNPGLVNIPSLPLAWRDAKKLLQALKGHGKRLEGDWVGGVPEVVEWWTGDHNSPTVLLANEQDEEERQPIWNVMGKITGIEQSEKSVIVGNHRDAWCFGAADPGSGTAVLLEVVHIFSELAEAGWRPLRTIQFASWDGEEYNLIGSTEWAEENMDDLRRNGIAYLNLDTAVSGHRFQASASPVFQAALLRALDRTADPYSNETLRSIWDRNQQQLQGLGAGSDYVAFQDMAGTSSFDMSFGSDEGDDGVLPVYHSCYDNFEWMAQFGDPGFAYHSVMAQIWALMILEVADRPVLPFDMEAYARAVADYVTQLEKDTRRDNDTIDLSKLHNATKQFKLDATQFAGWEQTWEEAMQESSGGIEPTALAIRRMSHNARMANFETHLLDLGQQVIAGDHSGGDEDDDSKQSRDDDEGGGIPGRKQFKHILYAPQIWNGYEAAYFPYVRDALHEKNWPLVQRQIDRAAEVLRGASWKLLH